MAQDLAIALVTGRPWLGREVAPTNVRYIDEENPGGLIHRRLRALGMTNDARRRLHYHSKQGMALDAPEFLVWIEAYVRAHSIGMVIVDTTTARPRPTYPTIARSPTSTAGCGRRWGRYSRTG